MFPDYNIMSGICSDIKEVMKTQKIYSVATASKNGVPNVVPVGMLFVGEDNKIWIVDNFFNKTLANIRENPEVAIYMWSPEHKGDSYQVKGKATIVSSGPDYEKAVFFAHSRMENAPAKNLIKVDVDEVYFVTPGPNAGKKI